MKKLLSLLSVLTISGTAMPNVIATSNYEKQEKEKNDLKINLRNLKTIDNPTLGINANNPAEVTYSEIANAIKSNILAKIKSLDSNINENDYNFLIYNSRNYRDIVTTVDMSKHWKTLFIKIFANENSKILFDKTGYISIKFPLSISKESKNTETDNSVIVLYNIKVDGIYKPIIEKIYGIKENYIRILGIDNNGNKYFVNDKNVYFVKSNTNNAILIKELNFVASSIMDFHSSENFVYFNWQNFNKVIQVHRIKIKDLENNINLNKIPSLFEIISNRILGTVKINNKEGLLNEQQIKDKLKELNPQVDISKIAIKNIIDDSYNHNEKIITIFSTDSTFYIGEVTIFLNVEK